MIIDINNVFLTGKVGWFKTYDIGNKSFTSMSIRIDTHDNLSFFIDVPLDPKKLASKSYAYLLGYLNDKNKSGIIYINGTVVNRKNKDDSVGMQIRCSLSNLLIAPDASPVNQVIVSGKVHSASDKSIVLNSRYNNPLDKTIKTRVIYAKPVAGLQADGNKELIIHGSLASKKIGDKEVLYINSEKAIVI